MNEPIDCRSPEGIAEGLGDCMIGAAWALAHGDYDLTPENVKGVLQDFFESPELAKLKLAAYAD